MTDYEMPWLDPDDIEPSKVFLTQGLSKPVVEGKIGVGRYFMAPDEVELKLGDTPGFRFVVLHTIKDRPMWMGDDTTRRLGCLGQMNREKGKWMGQLLLDPDQSDENANFLEELKAKNAGGLCQDCGFAGDIKSAPRAVDWKDACKFRWRYAIWIVDGLPEDYMHPPFVSFDLSGMPGMDGAGTMTTKISSYARQGIFWRTYRAIKPALAGSGQRQYFKWEFREDGKTEDSVLADIKERITSAQQIMTTESAKQIAAPAGDGEEKLPF